MVSGIRPTVFEGQVQRRGLLTLCSAVVAAGLSRRMESANR
jgi:hypothetical protein